MKYKTVKKKKFYFSKTRVEKHSKENIQDEIKTRGQILNEIDKRR